MSYLFQESNILKFPDKNPLKNDLHKNEYFNKIYPQALKTDSTSN